MGRILAEKTVSTGRCSRGNGGRQNMKMKETLSAA